MFTDPLYLFIQYARYVKEASVLSLDTTIPANIYKITRLNYFV